MDTIGRHVSRLSGYAPALPTPFADGGVDLSGLERYCHKQVHAGATALVVGTATAEVQALTPHEQREIVRIAAAAARGGVPVIAGIGRHATADAAALAGAAEGAGADAILCAAPAAGAAALAHFGGIAAATAGPLIVHDLPSAALSDDTIARLADDPRFIGVLDSHGDPARTARLRSRLGERFRILCGDDHAAVAMIANGANGCVSVTSNVAPGLCRALYLAVRRGHAGLARRIAAEVAKLNAVLCRSGDPAALKYALSLLGLMPARVREPLKEIDDDARAGIAAALAHFCEYNPDDGIGLAVAAIRVPASKGQRGADDPRSGRL